MEFSWRVTVICIIMLAATGLTGWFLNGDIEVAGYEVPLRLEQLVDQAEEQGSDYAPPNSVFTVSHEADTISRATLDQIELVTGQEPKECDFVTNSWHEDAAYALAAFAVLAIAAFLVIGLFIADMDIPAWVTALLVVVAFVIGTAVGDSIWERVFQSPVDEGVRFWRGVGAMVSIVVGIVLAHVADDYVPD